MGVLIVVAIVIIFYIVQNRIYEMHWDEKLNISISFSERMAAEGDLFEIVEVVENAKRLPLPTLRIKYATDRYIVAPKLSLDSKDYSVTDKFYYSDMIPIGGMKRVEKRLGCYSTKRGVYSIDAIYASAGNILLNKNMHETFENDSHILIHPSFVDMNDFSMPFNTLMGEMLSKLKLFEDPFEFRGLREYNPSDSMRRINWKASARGEDYLVNEYNQTVAKSVTLVVDYSNNGVYIAEEIKEEMLRLTVTVADKLLEEGYAVSIESNALSFFDDSTLKVPSGSGKAHMDAIFKATAVVDTLKKGPELADSELINIIRNDDGLVVYIGCNQCEALIEALRSRDIDNLQTMAILVLGSLDTNKMPADLLKNVTEWDMYGK